MSINMDLIYQSIGVTAEDELQREVTYLDYAGAALPPRTVIKQSMEEMLSTTFANPHTSGSMIGHRTHCLVEESRAMVASFLGTSLDDYIVVFTSGCTASLKLVADIFPWDESSRFVYPMNSHNSLMSMRSASQHWRTIPASLLFTDDTDDASLTASVNQIREAVPLTSGGTPGHGGFSLLAVPGECNFTGTKVNYNSVQQLLHRLQHEANNHKNLWLLDAAKQCASSPICLSELPVELRPDFVTLSFYKIFGYPTGLGALLIKKTTAPLLKKSYFGGGTLLAGAADSVFLVPRDADSAAHYEDGTPHYQGIIALRHGFRFLERLGGMQAISQHTMRLRQWLWMEMQSLRHDSGASLCTIYSLSKAASASPVTEADETALIRRQGPTIAFNLRYSDGSPVPFGDVARAAESARIHLRTGCFCNLGGCQELLHLSAEEVEENYHRGRHCSEDRDRAADVLGDRPTGACRVSLGYGSSLRDCQTFLTFLRDTFLNMSPTVAYGTIGDTDEAGTLKEEQVLHMNSTTPTAETDLFWKQRPQYFFPSLPPSSQDSLGSLVDSPQVEIVALYVYPVKSCAGVRVDRWPLLPPHGQGLLYDRIFAIVDDSDRVLSQKMHPALALVQPYFVFSEGKVMLHLTSPFTSRDLVLSIDEKDHDESDTPAKVSDEVLRICGRKVCGQRLSHDAEEWINEFFRESAKQIEETAETSQTETSRVDTAKSYRIVRASSTPSATTTAPTGSSKGSSGSVVDASFANTAQFLLLSVESVRSLIQMMAADDQSEAKNSVERVKVENFRPNIVVRGLPRPHAEDTWAELQVPVQVVSSPSTESAEGTTTVDQKVVRLLVTGPCARCTMVDVDGSRGVRSCRVFEALRGYRQHRRDGVCFGQFLSATETGQTQEESGYWVVQTGPMTVQQRPLFS